LFYIADSQQKWKISKGHVQTIRCLPHLSKGIHSQQRTLPIFNELYFTYRPIEQASSALIPIEFNHHMLRKAWHIDRCIICIARGC